MKHDERTSDPDAAAMLVRAKAQALKFYKDDMEKQLTQMAADLAHSGSTQEQIIEAIEGVRPKFDEGAHAMLRSVTIAVLKHGAIDG